MPAIKLVALGLVILISAYAADQGRDVAFRFHGLLIFGLACFLLVRLMRKTGGDPPPPPRLDQYDDGVVRVGVIATAFWGMAGLLVGVIIALQLTFPALNVDWAQPFGNFGR